MTSKVHSNHSHVLGENPLHSGEAEGQHPVLEEDTSTASRQTSNPSHVPATLPAEPEALGSLLLDSQEMDRTETGGVLVLTEESEQGWS